MLLCPFGARCSTTTGRSAITCGDPDQDGAQRTKVRKTPPRNRVAALVYRANCNKGAGERPRPVTVAIPGRVRSPLLLVTVSFSVAVGVRYVRSSDRICLFGPTHRVRSQFALSIARIAEGSTPACGLRGLLRDNRPPFLGIWRVQTTVWPRLSRPPPNSQIAAHSTGRAAVLRAMPRYARRRRQQNEGNTTGGPQPAVLDNPRASVDDGRNVSAFSVWDAI